MQFPLCALHNAYETELLMWVRRTPGPDALSCHNASKDYRCFEVSRPGPVMATCHNCYLHPLELALE